MKPKTIKMFHTKLNAPGIAMETRCEAFCRAASWNGKPGLQNNFVLINLYEKLVLFWKGAHKINVSRLRLCNWRATLMLKLKMPTRRLLLIKMRRQGNKQWHQDARNMQMYRSLAADQ